VIHFLRMTFCSKGKKVSPAETLIKCLRAEFYQRKKVSAFSEYVFVRIINYTNAIGNAIGMVLFSTKDTKITSFSKIFIGWIHVCWVLTTGFEKQFWIKFKV
jgi:hypothetical protein